MAGPVVTRGSMDALAQDEYARPTHRGKRKMKKKRKKKKGGRDFRGIDRKTGKKDNGPGKAKPQSLIAKAMAPGDGTPPPY